MARQAPIRDIAPTVQRLRLRYAKRDRLRFTSHRDFARAFERALRRCAVPMAYSAGFTPHPKISYAGAAPTGTASEAEYLEIALTRELDPAELVRSLDAALPPGLDILEASPARPGPLAELLTASAWRIELPGVALADLERAVAAFVASETVCVERVTKSGRKPVDTRAATVTLAPCDSGVADSGASQPEASATCAILVLVVRYTTPVVRPDDVLAGLRLAGDLNLTVPPRATRIAQGVLSVTEQPPATVAGRTPQAACELVAGWIADPLEPTAQAR
jgi:radical SAM-linked protein